MFERFGLHFHTIVDHMFAYVLLKIEVWSKSKNLDFAWNLLQQMKVEEFQNAPKINKQTHRKLHETLNRRNNQKITKHVAQMKQK